MNLTISRRRALSGLVALPMAAAQGDIASAPGSDLSSRLQNFLWDTQDDDGSWPSGTYGILRGGQALTSFVLFALLRADPLNAQATGTGKAIGWIQDQLRDGCLGIADPDVLEYPVYSTALALHCLNRLRESSAAVPPDFDLAGRIDSMRDYLLGEQFVEPRGFQSNDLAYGGWGFGGTHPPGQTGHMDLAHTRWALQALAEAGVSRRQYGPKAQTFLRLLQKHPTEDRGQPTANHTNGPSPSPKHVPYDGGFYFSPIVLAANKGRLAQSGDASFFRSYATATCDGILALLAAGVEATDPRVKSALRWLKQHPAWDYPAGIPRDHPQPWGDAVYFYHQAVRAEVYRRLAVAGDWPEQLLDRLAGHLDRDGSIRNRRSALMKEDDPILCSTLSLLATTEARLALSRRG